MQRWTSCPGGTPPCNLRNSTPSRSWRAVSLLGAMALIFGLIGAAWPALTAAQATATVTATVTICVDPEREGTKTHVLGGEDAIGGLPASPELGCRPATAGEVTIDLYESPTSEEDRGTRVASQATDSTGTVTFVYNLAMPFIYIGQGIAGQGGQFSPDTPIAAGQTLLFHVTNYVGEDGEAGAGPRLPEPVTVSAQVLRCADNARAGELDFFTGAEYQAVQAEYADCVPAVEGGATVDLYGSYTAAEDPGTLIASAETDGAGLVTFTDAVDLPYAYVGIGDQYALDTPVLVGETLSFVILQWVAAYDTVVEVRVLECGDSARAGTVDFVLDTPEAAAPPGNCRPVEAGAYNVALYESETLAEDAGEIVTEVATTDGGFVGFTYTGGLPAIYFGITDASDPGQTVLSADIPATGAPLQVTALVYVQSDGSGNLDGDLGAPVPVTTPSPIPSPSPSVAPSAAPSSEPSAAPSQLPAPSVSAAPSPGYVLGDPNVPPRTASPSPSPSGIVLGDPNVTPNA